MKKRIRLKKRFFLINKKIKVKSFSFILFIFIMLFITLIYTLNFISKSVTPTLINYAELEINRFSGLIINRAISSYVSDDVNIEELFIITKDNDGVIKTIDFNPLLVNTLLSKVTYEIQANLKNIIKGNIADVDILDGSFSDYDLEKLKNGIIFEIPGGMIFKNSLLSNLGPRIPVRLNLVGDVVSNINTKITNYGINNALMEVNVNIELTEQVILPFASKQVPYNVQVPVAIKMIQGTVPNYYFNGMDQKSPNVSIPIE